ncbi:MAG: hypothetical protein K6E68_05980 [Lachnospiraceae bacterium]|nr:hypothetical protein [Lachnospiraceae bacterium]
MSRLRFQNIQFHKDDLYIKGECRISDEGVIRLNCDDAISTDTLFNALSVGKWVEYTNIDNIRLCISLCGTFKITVYHIYLKNSGKNRVGSEVITETMVRTVGRVDKFFDIPVYETGLVYFAVSEVRKESFIYDAYYMTDISDVTPIKLAINICTYKRFDYLKQNVEKIKSELLDGGETEAAKTAESAPAEEIRTDEDEPTEDMFADVEFLDDMTDLSYSSAALSDVQNISDKIEVFITDNASELDKDVFGDSHIRLFHNKNLGGAGGFTNGLIRICKLKNRLGITHVLLMDDDAFIDTESIRRTYFLLTMLKHEYCGHFIAGAMNRTEDIYVQHENGALWNNGRCVFTGRDMDLRSDENLLLNEEKYDRDYAAWWYCAIPMSVVNEDNLPAPFFIHEDDVEYSLRNAEGIITMNGIAVWHTATLHKRASVNLYYNLRNMLMVNAIYRRRFGTSGAFRQACAEMTAALYRHRYSDMNMVVMAVTDYLKGPEYLMHLDAQKLHEKLHEDAYKFEYVGDIIDDKNVLLCTDEKITGPAKRGFTAMWSESHSIAGKFKVIGQILSLNGWILRPRRYSEAHFMNAHPAELYRAGRLILFDDANNMGLVLDKDFKQIFVLIGKLVKVYFALLFGYRRAARRYNAGWKDLTSMKYWGDALK